MPPCYSIVIPPFEAPDEIWHFAFVQHLVTQRTLPVAEPNTQALWRQQGTQAPGYYAGAALLTALIDQSDFPDIFARANPHRAIGEPDAAINRNYLIHHRQVERFPWRRSILALHVARLFSVFLGAVTVYAVYRTLRLLVAAGAVPCSARHSRRSCPNSFSSAVPSATTMPSTPARRLSCGS